MAVSQFQIIAAIVWGITCVILFPATLRTFRGKAKDSDEWKAAFFFVGALLTAFPSRWLVAPNDMTTWKVLYALGISLAFYVWLLLWNGRKR